MKHYDAIKVCLGKHYNWDALTGFLGTPKPVEKGEVISVSDNKDEQKGATARKKTKMSDGQVNNKSGRKRGRA